MAKKRRWCVGLPDGHVEQRSEPATLGSGPGDPVQVQDGSVGVGDQETYFLSITTSRCGVDEEELDSEESDEESYEVLDQATEALEEEEVETEAVKKRVEFADLAAEEKRLESPVKEHSPENTAVENTLQQEFALLDTSNFNFLTVTELDLEKRVARVVATTAHSRLLLLASFPSSYPVAVSPVFTFLKGSTMNPTGKTKILRSLQDTAQQQVLSFEALPNRFFFCSHCCFHSHNSFLLVSLTTPQNNRCEEIEPAWSVAFASLSSSWSS